jgi:hypothetical protein
VSSENGADQGTLKQISYLLSADTALAELAQGRFGALGQGLGSHL